jgi:hypothetical protein
MLCIFIKDIREWFDEATGWFFGTMVLGLPVLAVAMFSFCQYDDFDGDATANHVMFRNWLRRGFPELDSSPQGIDSPYRASFRYLDTCRAFLLASSAQLVTQYQGA